MSYISPSPGSGSSGVASLNALTGAVTLSEGAGINFNITGNNIEIEATGGSGVVFGGAQTGFTPTMVQYIDSSGLQYGDTFFVRDDITNDTFIGQLIGSELRRFAIDSTKQSIDIVSQDIGTGEKASIGNGNGPILNSFTYEDGINQFSEIFMATGQTRILWDFDNTDTIEAFFEQSEDIAGMGLLSGSGLLWTDTGINIIASTMVGDGTMGGLAPGTTFSSTFDTVTNDRVVTYTAISGGSASWSAGVDLGNARSTIAIRGNGNYMEWDADSVGDTLVDRIDQGQNVFGLGGIGNGIIHRDTASGEFALAFVGDGTGLGANPFTVALNTFDSIGGITTFWTQDKVQGITGGTDDGTTVANFDMNLTTGNIWLWDVLASDQIYTTIEQNQDVAGLGFFAGSALTWVDNSTSIVAIVGALDETPMAGFPGSTRMITIDTGTADNAFVNTFFDTGNNQMTFEASTLNGIIVSSLQFNASHARVVYSPDNGGEISEFIAANNELHMAYTLNGTTEYRAQLSDGLFQFLDFTNTDVGMSYDLINGIYGLGDLLQATTGTRFIMNVPLQILDFSNTGVTRIGDPDSLGNSLLITVNDAGKTILLDSRDGVLIAGDGTGFGNNVYWSLNDTNEEILINNENGEIVIGDGTGTNGQGFYVNNTTLQTKAGDYQGIGNGTMMLIDDTAGIQTISLFGGQRRSRTSVTDAAYTILLEDHIVVGEGLSVDRVFTLPVAGATTGDAEDGHFFVIKNDPASAGNITLTPNATDTIDGVATLSIPPGDSATVSSDGAGNWEII